MKIIFVSGFIGLFFGVIDWFIVSRLEMENKKMVQISGLFSRSAIGFFTGAAVVGMAAEPWRGALAGAITGLWISLPPSFVNRSYKEIVPLGIIYGLIIGIVASFLI